VYATLATIRSRAVHAGRLTIVLPTRIRGRRLALGPYRLAVTPADAAGHPGRTVTYALVLARR
jgi:hypothetical protein